MKIDILTDSDSWINQYITRLLERLGSLGHEVGVLYDVDAITSGELLFMLGCGQIVPEERLLLHKHNLVVHESDLPSGKGWSPVSWQILEGKKQIPITLFECEKTVDSGVIYLQEDMCFTGYELIDEIRKIQGNATIDLCVRFVGEYPAILETARVQVGESTYYQRRTAVDSKLDLDKTLREQFNLLRIVDNNRYPAFFEIDGVKYNLRVEKGNG